MKRHLSVRVFVHVCAFVLILRPWWQYFPSHVFNDYTTFGYILISLYMFICFCTCEYVQFCRLRDTRSVFCGMKLEGCIFIDWRIRVFNVHLPLVLFSCFLYYRIPNNFLIQRFQVSLIFAVPVYDTIDWGNGWYVRPFIKQIFIWLDHSFTEFNFS